MTDAICCVPSSCSAVSLAWLCGRPHISEFCPGFVPHGQRALLDSDMCALIDRSSCLVRSLRTFLSSQTRLLEICNTGHGDCTAASLEPGIKMFWISAKRWLGIFWIICTCRCTRACSRCSDRTVQGMEPVVLSGGVLALYLWALHLCWHYETSVICCTIWQVLLMYCTLWQLQQSLHLVDLVSLHTEAGES